jgi:RNA polymerase sigma factor (sigma-70 family)
MSNENYSELPDDHLLQLMMEDDQKAFSAIYRRHWPALYNAAFKRLSNHFHCHDVLQNAFVDLWTRRNELQIENLTAYLHGAVRFQVYKMVHKEQRNTTFFDSFANMLTAPLSDEALLDSELKDLFDSWILALPEKRREIFRLHYEMYFSTSEIADKLDISQKTVQNQLNRASTELRARLTGLLSFLVGWLLSF